MKHLHKHLFAASLLAVAGLAMAQAPQAPASGAPAAQAPQGGPMAGRMGERMGRGDPARMQQRMAERHGRHMADLKAQLKLTPAQESAWTSFSTAMQPPADFAARRAEMQQKHAELDKLSTPERIDRMNALRAERQTRMNTEITRRGDAVKTFYATLSAEQKRVLDEQHARHGRKGGHGGMGMGGMHRS
jgi:periplasmic protein CpxP/Spy